MGQSISQHLDYSFSTERIHNVEQHGHKVPMSEVMRSSVIQYDSDDVDNTESIQPETAAVQHNSNGIARVVVGGNEVIDNVTTSPTDKCADKELVTDHNLDSGAEIVIKHTSDNIISTSRQNGDGATSPDFAIPKQTDLSNATHEIGSPLSDNTLDGIYDNLGLASPDRTPTAEQKIPLSVEELLKSCEMEDQSKEVIENNSNKTETADSQNLSYKGEPRFTKEEKTPDVIDKTEADDDDDDDEYELVLTGLKQLTKGINIADIQAETRYPHQIISAMATNDTNKSRPVPAKDKTAPFQTTSIPTVPTHITPIVLPTTSQAPSKATPASTPTPAVKMRSRSTQPDSSVKSDNSKRPQSVSSGLHLIRTNNELRRSVRRKGQYKSIAEYEKLNNNCGDGLISVDSQVTIANPQPSGNHRDSLHSLSQIDVSHTTQAPPTGKRTPQPIRHVKHKPTLSPEMYRSITSLSGMPHHITNRSQHQSEQVNMRSKDDRTRSSYRNLARETEAGSRRQSVISISSVPNHVVLRRVDSKHAEILTKAEKKAEAERRSRSFDRKNNISLQEGVMPQGLTLVGSRTSLVSHGRSQTNVLSNQSQKVHRNKERVGLQQMSLGEPNATPILDGKRKAHAAQRTRTTPISSKLQGSHIPGFKKQTSRSQYVSLPNQPDLAFYRHQHLTTPQFNWNGVSWDQNPGFKRFFDSILTYGPNGSKSASRDKVKHSNAHNNQPDIVLESLNHDHSRADDSDSENSSIRSSASAYWPPELKLQCNNGEEFEEETASWQFHNAIGQPHHPINAA